MFRIKNDSIGFSLVFAEGNIHRMIGKVYKSKKVCVIVRHSEDIKFVIATSNHIVSFGFEIVFK